MTNPTQIEGLALLAFSADGQTRKEAMQARLTEARAIYRAEAMRHGGEHANTVRARVAVENIEFAMEKAK